MIPTTHEEWISEIPWGVSDRYFFDVAREYRQNPFPIEPFTLFNGRPANAIPDVSYDRTLHELGHVIVCRDDQLMDPFYGIHDFAADEKDRLSTSSLLVECEVDLVETWIRWSMLKGEELRKWRKEQDFRPRNLAYLMKDIGQIPGGTSEEVFLCQTYDRLLRKWSSVDVVWKELERKRRVIAELLA